MAKTSQQEDTENRTLLRDIQERGEEEQRKDWKGTFRDLYSIIKRPGLFCALSCGLANAAHFVLLGKVAHISSPMQSLFTKSIFLLTFVLLVSWKKSDEYDWRDMVLNILYGLCETVGASFSIFAIALTSSADASAIVFNQAIPAVILARILVGERIDVIKAALILVNAVGIFLICKASVDESQSSESSALGIMLAFCGLFFLSLLYILVRVLAQRKSDDAALLTFMVGCVTTIFCSSYLSVTKSWAFPKTNHDIILFLSLGGASLWGFYSFARALKTENAYIVASSVTLSVAFTYCYEVIFLNRIISWKTIFGVCFTVGSTLLLYAHSFYKDYVNERIFLK